MEISNNYLADEREYYRRKLPHFRSDFVIYFVTWHLHAGAPVLHPDERTVVSDALDHFHGQRYDVPMYVVMDNHVHVLVHLFPDVTLTRIVHSWKSFTTNRLQRDFGRKGVVWQHECYDRIVRDGKELVEVHDYILNNPVKKWPELAGTEYRWLKMRPESFPFVDG